MTTHQIILPEDRVSKLTPEQLEAIRPNRGRTATPSRYLVQVQEAVDNPDETFGIELYDGYDLKPVQVLGELRKAAGQLNVKLQTFDRSKEPAPFIGYKLRTPKPEDLPGDKEHAEILDQEAAADAVVPAAKRAKATK
jgi:hypothetical protein